VNNGRWADFATGEKGGDLISLYAAVYGIKNGEAFKQLSDDNSFRPLNRATPTPRPAAPPEIEVTAPPADAGAPVMTHPTFGPPTTSWCYRDEIGKPQFYVARYEPEGGKKQIVPWSWAPSKARFIQKGFITPRPLYGLELLATRPDMPIMIVEGEKAADAARLFAGHVYVVMSWSHGVQSIDKSDWTTISGRKILLWPDADAPGIFAMQAIGARLEKSCPEVKILDVTGQPKGWDAADSGFDNKGFFEWAKPRAQKWTPAIDTALTAAEPVQDEATIEVVPPKKPPQTVLSDEDMGEVPASLTAAYEQLGIATTRQGNPVCNADNALRVLEGWPAFKDLIWFDDFHCKFFTKTREGIIREWRDLDEINLFLFMQRELGLKNITQTMVQAACISYAHRHPRNEPMDWMNSLEWDGKERIDSTFTYYFGAELGEYALAAAKNWWISMVSRVYQPGSKVDSMVILEGAQGKFKSTALSVIGGKWYAEAHESVTSKDFFLLLQGKLILEISELDAFSKAENNTIKKVITCQTDRFRPPYGRVSMDFPRRCVFVGTTNQSHYLKDETGARRFWPVQISRIDIAGLMRDREQLFAEAVHRFKTGERWYEMPSETAEIQESRRQHDEWESVISQYLIDRDEVTLGTIATACLGILLAKLDAMTQRRIGKVLRQLNWEAKAIRENGVVKRVWTKREV
jgi:putative DNA primase/helicase